MQLAIIQNPQIENEDERIKIWNTLDDVIDGKQIAEEKQPELDMSGFQMLKTKMTTNPRIIVK